MGGHKKVDMADLRALLRRLGFTEAQSLLQSGNLVFRSSAKATSRLERALEAATARHLNLQTDIFVRTAAEWTAIVSRNPFRKEAAHDPGHLLMMCLKDAPAAADVSALQATIAGRETASVDGRHAYIVYPDGIGNSRLTHARIEKELGTHATGRNWNTVLKLAAASSASG